MEKTKKNKKQRKLLTILIGIMLIIDQITKIFVYNKGFYIENSLNIETNNGYYILMSIIIIIMLIRYISNENTFIQFDTKLILSFAIAGATGNMIDRIWHEKVINFIKLGNSFELNFAYIYIVIAWIGMAIILTKNSMRFINERKLKKEKLDEFPKNNNKK